MSSRQDARRARRADDDHDDGALPWWEQDRRGLTPSSSSTPHPHPHSHSHQQRGFDDDRQPPHRPAAGYYDRDAAPDRHHLDYHGGSSSRGYDGGRGGGQYARGGYGRGDSYQGRRDGEYGGRSARDSYGHTSRPQAPAHRSSNPSFVAASSQQFQHSPAPPSAAIPTATSATPSSSGPPPPSAEEGECVPLSHIRVSPPSFAELMPPSLPRRIKSVDEPELDLTPVVVPDPEAILAERRRKRAEILAKYASATPSAAPSGGATPDVKREAPNDESAAPGTPAPEVVERAAKRLRIGTGASSRPRRPPLPSRTY